MRSRVTWIRPSGCPLPGAPARSVLGEHGAVALGQPAEQIVRDPGVVGAVLAVAAVRGSEGKRLVGGKWSASVSGPSRRRSAPGSASRRSSRPAARRHRRARSRRAGAVLDLRVAAAGVELELPAPARLDGLSSSHVRYSGSPPSTRPASTNMTALKPSWRRMPSPPVHEFARASSKVSSSGLGGSSTGSPWTKSRRSEGRSSGSRHVDHRQLLGEVLEADPVGRVRGVGEVALGPDPVVRSTGMAERSGGSACHTCFSSAVSDLGSGLRCPGGGRLGRLGDVSGESPQAANPRHNPQVKAASTSANIHRSLTVTAMTVTAGSSDAPRLDPGSISSTLLFSCAFGADSSAARRVPDRPALKVARMAADSLVARHREMPGGRLGLAFVDPGAASSDRSGRRCRVDRRGPARGLRRDA